MYPLPAAYQGPAIIPPASLLLSDGTVGALPAYRQREVLTSVAALLFPGKFGSAAIACPWYVLWLDVARNLWQLHVSTLTLIEKPFDALCDSGFANMHADRLRVVNVKFVVEGPRHLS
jgi:hypothetical protein